MIIRKILGLFLLVTFPLNVNASVNSRDVPLEEEHLSFVWGHRKTLTSENEKEIKNVFLNSFSKAYEAYTKEDLKITTFPSKEQWLEAGFSEEIKDFKNQEPPINLLLAYYRGAIIGAATTERDQKIANAVYIRQMAIVPQYWEKGIGKKMIKTIEEEGAPNIASLVLVARIVNERADRFYQRLGFEKGAYTHPDYSPETYVGYKKELKKIG